MNSLTYYSLVRTKKIKQRLVVVFLLPLISCSQPSQQELKMSAYYEWSAVAKADLDFVYETIKAAHPGVLEHSDVAFQAWLHQGYSKALSLAKRAQTQEQALAALRFYTVGFKDGHLGVSPQNYSSNVNWAGWNIQKQGEEFVVTYQAKEWPISVPPMGSRVIACDGQSVSEYIKYNISPYIDERLNLLSTWSMLAHFVTIETPDMPLWESKRIKHCTVELKDKTKKEYSLLWKKSYEGVQYAFADRAPKQGLRNLGKGIYWINVSNFQLSQAENIELERFLDKIKVLRQAKKVILDTRGNRGGSSQVGTKILRALLKDKIPTESAARAFWRVSPVAKKTLEEHLDYFSKTFGKASIFYLDTVRLLEQMNAALAIKQEWLEQLPDTIDSKIEAREAFNGQLIILTDLNCASACLDFVDSVRRVPGAIHMGLPTSGDTFYIDVAKIQLPSKNLQLSLPLKIWRDRARGLNQAYYPDFLYEGNIYDTQSFENWVMGKLENI
ncbi:MULTISPECIES: S41 family peptidase [Methylomonas]|uniref:Tail specific protease domain-containing protein n=1 Tax=Methylomonas koyamae TaxID=702114 RepID=A0A177NN12_9GAMM|nr:S41 family peptidase [Methylomonas koyamae]OAI19478.1 hypothetical protein A1355_04390 [Methylomonas koyamae]